MKKFILFLFVAVMGWSLITSCQDQSSVLKLAEAFSTEPPRLAGQADVVGLRVDPIPVVRAAFIGIGNRGSGSLQRFLYLENVEVKAICDIELPNIERAQAIIRQSGKPDAAVYTGEEDWKKVCERDDIDIVYVTTHWDLHAPICIYAMEQGKHAISEIPLALTMEECWQLVNTAERTRRHCIMMENTCYDFFEMATLNMAQKGLFGEIVHVEGAYIHDLRDDYMFRERGFDERNGRINSSGYWNFWRLKQNTDRNAAHYPMHGLGPVAQILNINRGDKLDYLVTLGSNQFNMTAYAKEKYGANSEEAKREYKKGDMSNVLIKTAKGKSILIQHDVVSPRPYNRHHTISGTKGFAQKYPIQQLALEPNPHRAVNNEEMAALLSEYEHPIIKEIGELAQSVGGHGGMDFIMVYRLVYCLQNGLPLDMNVYDGVVWSSVIPLSEFSLENGSIPVRVPDFTRGSWQKEQGLKFAYK